MFGLLFAFVDLNRYEEEEIESIDSKDASHQDQTQLSSSEDVINQEKHSTEQIKKQEEEGVEQTEEEVNPREERSGNSQIEEEQGRGEHQTA